MSLPLRDTNGVGSTSGRVESFTRGRIDAETGADDASFCNQSRFLHLETASRQEPRRDDALACPTEMMAGHEKDRFRPGASKQSWELPVAQGDFFLC